MAVLARGLDVPFMVQGEKAKELLNKKPTLEQVKESKRRAEKAATGVFVVKK